MPNLVHENIHCSKQLPVRRARSVFDNWSFSLGNLGILQDLNFIVLMLDEQFLFIEPRAAREIGQSSMSQELAS